MHSMLSRFSRRSVIRLSLWLSIFGIALASAFTAGCGGGTAGGSGPVQGENTSVVILASSTANDQLSQFNLTINSLTLTSQAGKSVTVFSTPQNAEFIHLNGGLEPLTTVSIPQDVYTSATATVGRAEFTCVGLVPATGGLDQSTFAYGQTPSANVTVNLPSPITITDTGMGLLLNLAVAQSASFSSCVGGVDDTYLITPTFNITPLAISAQPTDNTNGKATDLHGLIGSANAGGTGFSVNSADGQTWQVTSSGSTVYQGVSGSSQLAAGMPVDMDAAIQEDGSLLATRVAVYETNTGDLTVESGPLLFEDGYEPALISYGVEVQGSLSIGSNSYYYSFDNAVFQTSSQLTNVQGLPFAASFNAANMVAGQNVFVSTNSLIDSGGFPYTPAGTITLIPQTINGTVSAIGSKGGFTTYTVTLAPYDLFPALAVQQGQTTLLTNPDTVVVYADSSTQMLNTSPIAVGGVARFYGLVFNDNGTLRMDCAQANDGVAE